MCTRRPTGIYASAASHARERRALLQGRTGGRGSAASAMDTELHHDGGRLASITATCVLVPVPNQRDNAGKAQCLLLGAFVRGQVCCCHAPESVLCAPALMRLS